MGIRIKATHMGFFRGIANFLGLLSLPLIGMLIRDIQWVLVPYETLGWITGGMFTGFAVCAYLGYVDNS